MLPHMELGRINQDSLQAVWQDHPALKALRERHQTPLSTFAFCAGCEYMNYCTGSCPGLAYTITGKEEHPAPHSCLRNFLRQGGRLPDRALLEDKARQEITC
jgi:radical SAM protein with 4Fe4S-binding SPASM domain